MKHRKKTTSFDRELLKIRDLAATGDEQAIAKLVRLDRALERKPSLIKRLYRKSRKAQNKRDQRGVWWNVHTLDVWGNAEEGFEVNQSFLSGQIRTPQSTEGIRKALIREWLHRDPKSIDVRWDSEDFVEVDDAETGKPLLQLTLARPPERRYFREPGSRYPGR